MATPAYKSQLGTCSSASWRARPVGAPSPSPASSVQGHVSCSGSGVWSATLSCGLSSSSDAHDMRHRRPANTLAILPCNVGQVDVAAHHGRRNCLSATYASARAMPASPTTTRPWQRRVLAQPWAQRGRRRASKRVSRPLRSRPHLGPGPTSAQLMRSCVPITRGARMRRASVATAACASER